MLRSFIKFHENHTKCSCSLKWKMLNLEILQNFTHLFDNACHILLNGGFSHVDAILIQISVQVYRGYSSRVGCSHVKSRVCDVAKKYEKGDTKFRYLITRQNCLIFRQQKILELSKLFKDWIYNFLKVLIVWHFHDDLWCLHFYLLKF